MKTRSYTFSNPNEVKEKLDNLKSEDFNPEIAFIFVTPRQGIPQISAALTDSQIKVVGSSSGGNILAGVDYKTIHEEKGVVTLIDLDPDHFAYICTDRGDRSSFVFGEEIGKWGASCFKNPCFIIVASGLSLNGQELVEGIMETAGEDITMFGGLAGDETKFEQNYVFSGQQILENGAIVLALDEEHIEIHGLATSGWVGLGKDLVITSSVSNIVYSIDNQPALKVYKKYLSVQDDDLPAIGVEYPLLIKRDFDSYALRAVMGVDREREALIFAGTVPQDATVTFSSSPGFEVIDRTREKIKKFHEQHPETEMILLFSCMARHLALGPTISEEISYPSEIWGLPLTGFFTYGEIGTNEGKACDFFNQTFTLVILREK